MKGSIVKLDTVKNLLMPVSGLDGIVVTIKNKSDNTADIIKDGLSGFDGLSKAWENENTCVINSKDRIPYSVLSLLLEKNNIAIDSIKSQSPSLEEVFISVTGIKANEMKKEKRKRGRIEKESDITFCHS